MARASLRRTNAVVTGRSMPCCCSTAFAREENGFLRSAQYIQGASLPLAIVLENGVQLVWSEQRTPGRGFDAGERQKTAAENFALCWLEYTAGHCTCKHNVEIVVVCHVRVDAE